MSFDRGVRLACPASNRDIRWLTPKKLAPLGGQLSKVTFSTFVELSPTFESYFFNFFQLFRDAKVTFESYPPRVPNFRKLLFQLFPTFWYRESNFQKLIQIGNQLSKVTFPAFSNFSLTLESYFRGTAKVGKKLEK